MTSLIKKVGNVKASQVERAFNFVQTYGGGSLVEAYGIETQRLDTSKPNNVNISREEDR